MFSTKSLIHLCATAEERQKAHAIERDVRFSHPKSREHLITLVARTAEQKGLTEPQVIQPNGDVALLSGTRTIITWKATA